MPPSRFVHAELYWFGIDPSDRRLRLSRASVDRALDIDPDLPEGHHALGVYHYYGHREYEAALEELEIALGLKPHDAEVQAMIGFVVRRQGRFVESLAYLERAVRLDPRNTNRAGGFCVTLLALRRYEQATRCAEDRIIAIQPDAPQGYTLKALTQLAVSGDVEEARQILEAAEGYVPPQGLFVTRHMLDLYASDYERALERLRSNTHPQEMVMSQYHRYPRALDFADAHHFLGNIDSARVYYEIALPTLERIRREDPEWPGPDLARAYAGLGRSDGVVREAELILSLVPYSFDAALNPHLRFDLAASYAMVGEVDRALDQMELALAVPTTYGSPVRFRLWPFFRSLRGHPRFEALLEESESVRF